MNNLKTRLVRAAKVTEQLDRLAILHNQLGQAHRIQVNAGVIDSVIEIGEKVYDLAENIPGVGWAAKLRKMSLSENKYLRAFQILSLVVPFGVVLDTPVSIYNLIKNLASGDPEVKNMVQQAAVKALKKAQQDHARAQTTA